MAFRMNVKRPKVTIVMGSVRINKMGRREVICSTGNSYYPLSARTFNSFPHLKNDNFFGAIITFSPVFEFRPVYEPYCFIKSCLFEIIFDRGYFIA